MTCSSVFQRRSLTPFYHSGSRTTHIFYGYGGSGSSFLVTQLYAFRRPDVWQPAFKGHRLVEWESLTKAPGELLDDQGYETRNVNWAHFHARTDFKFRRYIDETLSIKENLLRFCRWIEKTPYKVMFVHAAIVGFFGYNNIHNVTYMIRHPLHSYVSFAKTERHQAEIDALGGLESARAIEFWTDRWNRIAQDYLKSVERQLNPVLIRFEHAVQDSQITRYHQAIFRSLIPSKRNVAALSDESANYLKSLVFDTYAQIYDDWDI